MPGYLADIASNPTSNVTLLPPSSPVLEDEWTIAQPPDTPSIIHYPQVGVGVSFLVSCGAVSLSKRGSSGTSRWRSLSVITVYFSSHT
jgi:hypothetical protein